MTLPIVVCADDYGCSSSVCDAILDLAANGRISAISCMTASPLWPEQARRLASLQNHADIGVHLTLVDDAPLTKMPLTAPHGRLPGLAALITGSYRGALALDEIAAEIRAQCDAFVTALGCPPSYLDGHRHTHVLPGIRDVVLDVVASYRPRPWVRNIAEPMGRIFTRRVAVPKTLVLTALGGPFVRAAAAAGVAMNDGFSGVYALNADADMPALFERFLTVTGRRPLIMCHPGAVQDATPLAATRVNEYAFLRSQAFTALLARRGFHVARFTA